MGFDEDLRYQVEAVAGAFGLELAALEHHADQELGRFVSRAGRYRLVSPRLVAIWLASDLIERTPGFADVVFGLPDPLRDAFIEQLDLFGPDVPHLPAALFRVLEDERFRSPQSFDEAAGRLLRASAAIVPAQVADAIAQLVTSASTDGLRTLPRRDLVWALEVLLWWPETWEQAVEAMYALAQNETEDLGNNATGQFVQFFSIVLSGTTVPFIERARWLRRRIEGADPAELPLLARAAAQALKDHHTRSITGFRGGGEPQDWHPQSSSEWVEAWTSGWDLLLLTRERSREPRQRAEITKMLANSIRAAFRAGVAPHVERSLRAGEWETIERATLAAGVRNLLQFDEDLPEELREASRSVHDWLLGEALDERAAVMLSTSVWDLWIEPAAERLPPELLRRLADDVLDLPAPVNFALGLGPDVPDQETRYHLLRCVAERVGADALGTAALSADPRDWTAVSAALSVADDQGRGAWATEALKVVRHDAPERLARLLRFVTLTPDRVELVLDAVDEGTSSAEDLAGLLYGAPVALLDEGPALRIISAAATAGRVEEAMGMLDQWLEQHDERGTDARATAAELARLSVVEGGGSMVDYYLGRLLDADIVPSDVVSELWRDRVTHLRGLAEALDRRLLELVLAHDSEAVVDEMLEIIRRQAAGEGTFGQYASGDLSLLSRAAQATSAEAIWARLETLPGEELRWAIHHMAWHGTEPEPLVRALLTSARLPEVADEASACFFNTLGTVMGSLARAFDGELARARSWQVSLDGTSAAAWAQELVEGYVATVEWERRREEEREIWFR